MELVIKLFLISDSSLLFSKFYFMTAYFIAGIDTGIGKTVATGLLARYLMAQDRSIITAKLAQTGSEQVAEDIRTHRKIMGTDLFWEDTSGMTCRYVFDYPASPHLAAEAENAVISPEVICKAVADLEETFDIVLVEGVGGIMVPLTRDLLSIEMAAKSCWPLIIVSSGRLGSINHTLMTMQCADALGCRIAGVIYNLDGCDDDIITSDSRAIIKEHLANYNRNAVIVDMPAIDNFDQLPDIDFSGLVN